MKKISLWERYITKEIGIEFKACLYFFAMLVYYCCYKLFLGERHADILHLAEMIFSNYIIGYIQVYLLWNFDEADELGKKEIFGIAVCTVIYSILAYFCGWFDNNIFVVLGFAAYTVAMYVCVYLIYKTRRRIDEKILNSELELFKAKREKEDK